MEVEFKKLPSTYAKVKFLLDKMPDLRFDSDKTILPTIFMS